MAISISDLDGAKGSLQEFMEGLSSRGGLRYSDCRIDVGEGKGTVAQDGNSKGADESSGASLGIRVFVLRNNVVGSGMAGTVLGEVQLADLKKTLSKLAELSLRRARQNAACKAKTIHKFKRLGKGIRSKAFDNIEAHIDTVRAKFSENPLNYSLEDLVKRCENTSKDVAKEKGIASNIISAGTGIERKIFCSTAGSLIDQSKAISQTFVFVTAKGKAIESYYLIAGSCNGAESFEGENDKGKSIEDFAMHLAKGTVELSNAPAAKQGKEVAVVLDPGYNTLLSHEIMGHPSEADRALKREAAWAGRSWWFKGLKDNLFGKKVGSELLTVFSDPSMEGYGNYKYDDEGVLAKKVYNIKNGILNEFLNSRETAEILGKQPNGGMRASSAMDMPLIRMNNTCIAPGDWNAEEIISDTKSGFYAVGEKIPSIGETRQNFTITCWKLYEIRNGEVGRLYRNGGITGDSPKFLESIDAVGRDFHCYNVPNCGKGTPMQTMQVGNGGPTIRARARISASFGN